MDPTDKPNLTPLQKRTVEMAADVSNNSAWYRGIYIVDIPSDEEILDRGIEVVANELSETTFMINY